MSLTSHYASLPEGFFAAQNPVPVKAPSFIAVNDALAEVLQLDADFLKSDDGLGILAGNSVLPNTHPIAMAYSGHQFGHWSGQLGDGRAVLLGEAKAADGQLYDVQLKGAGRTPFSRGGDGRSALGPVIREYLVSEAMAALGVPTTRALAAVRTGEPVLREGVLPGGILTRVARAHVRVGTFQHFAARKDVEAIKTLTRFCVERLYADAPDMAVSEQAAFLLEKTIAEQAQSVAHWMSLGFIHGVMNTDNMAISGETIDYGPCAFMDTYHPDTVYSSIDRQGRYAFQNQPGIAHWNLSCLASTLLPVLDEQEDAALKQAQVLLDRFPALYEDAYSALMKGKLGLPEALKDAKGIIGETLNWMQREERDYTNTLRGLAEGDIAPPDCLQQAWQALGGPQGDMTGVNPAYIPRNHQVERAIRASVDKGDDSVFHALHAVLSQPFQTQQGRGAFAAPPLPEEVVHQTFCGT